MDRYCCRAAAWLVQYTNQPHWYFIPVSKMCQQVYDIILYSGNSILLILGIFAINLRIPTKIQRISLKLYFPCSVYVIRLLARAQQPAEFEHCVFFLCGSFLPLCPCVKMFLYLYNCRYISALHFLPKTSKRLTVGLYPIFL